MRLRGKGYFGALFSCPNRERETGVKRCKKLTYDEMSVISRN